MAAIVSAKKDEEKMVKVRYIPVKSNYKNYALPVSAIVNGRRFSATLKPGATATIPLVLAKQLKSNSIKSRIPVSVPDGLNMEERMKNGLYALEREGVKYDERIEEEPDYEIIIDGDID